MIDINNDNKLLKTIIQTNVKSYLMKDFSHVFMPQMVFAKITKGGSDKVNIKILDKDNEIDKNYEELPDIEVDTLCEYCKSCEHYKPYKTGDRVIVSFIHGELEHPIIIRKWNK